MQSDHLKNLLAPVITDLGFEFVGLELNAHGNHKLLRIYIDCLTEHSGVTVDDCATVSHAVSAVLDVEDPITGNYRLEVSSPGINRPLFELAQFERFIGQRAKVRLKQKVNGRKNFVGIIKQVNQASIVLEFEDEVTKTLSELVFDFDELSRANLAPVLA